MLIANYVTISYSHHKNFCFDCLLRVSSHENSIAHEQRMNILQMDLGSILAGLVEPFHPSTALRCRSIAGVGFCTRFARLGVFIQEVTHLWVFRFLSRSTTTTAFATATATATATAGTGRTGTLVVGAWRLACLASLGSVGSR